MNILNLFKIRRREILKKVEKKNHIVRVAIYAICVFLSALSYNIFFVPNDLVIGGMGGLAIVVKKVTGLSTSIFLLLSTIILLIVSYIFLGRDETKKNLICAIIYPIVVAVTEPLANPINIEFSSYLFTCLVAVVTYGVPLGIIYKIGYSTGGADMLNQIICKYAKTSVGQAGNYINIIIILIAGFVIGIPKTIYAVFTLLIETTIIDFIILGNSDSKLCIIKTKNIHELENVLKKEYNIGYSILSSSGGIDTRKRDTIMCVVTSRDYYNFQNLIINIDPNAFFVTHDCYEVLGGTRKKII